MAISTKEVNVTPELATKWLEGNIHNRSVRDSVVARYARDMKAGDWQLTHQGLAFDKVEADPNRRLVDGQHRLYAVLEAGVPVRMLVSFNVPIEAQGVIDDTLQRTMVDTLKLAHGRTDVSNMHVAIAKRLVGHTKQGRLTRHEVVDALNTHDKAIAFAVGLFERKVRGISTAPVMSVITRAYYTADRDAVSRFVEALTTGLINEQNGEQPILILRNWLLEKAPIRGGSSTQTEAIYGKTERALSAYLEGERIAILYTAAQELFPLPAEVSRKVGRGAKKKANGR